MQEINRSILEPYFASDRDYLSEGVNINFRFQVNNIILTFFFFFLTLALWKDRQTSFNLTASRKNSRNA